MEDWTLGQAITILLSIAGGVSLLMGVTNQIIDMHKRAKAPNEKQDSRIMELEGQAKEINRKLDRDNKRIIAQAESTRLTHRALLALLDHGLNGNNVDQMAEARKALQEHLINQ